MFVETTGARLYVERAGSGAPLLNLSGSGSALSQGFSPANLPFSQRFDVVGYDHRGLGMSECSDESPTMADFARDALAVADAVGFDRFLLVGTSFGGMVAQHVAAMAPTRIVKLVLACTSSGGPGGSSYPLHERPDEQTRLQIMDTRQEAQEQMLALLANMPQLAPPEPGYSRQLAARKDHDAYDLLPLITAPTLVAAGRYDGLAPLANSEALAARIPGAVLDVFEGGHGFFLQDPRAFPAMLDFLSD